MREFHTMTRNCVRNFESFFKIYCFSHQSGLLKHNFTPFSRWLDNPIDDKNRVLDTRDQAVLQFANSLLKRTLSETFVGVPLSDDGFYSLSSGSTGDPVSPPMDTECGAGGKSTTTAASHKRNKFIINARSLSLELAKYNHKLAAQLVGGSHEFVVVVVLVHIARTHEIGDWSEPLK
jgi:poly(ADP-ribose) glycohydrolase